MIGHFWSKTLPWHAHLCTHEANYSVTTLLLANHWFHGFLFEDQESLLTKAGIILCMRQANERRLYNVTSSTIGWAHTQMIPIKIPGGGGLSLEMGRVVPTTRKIRTHADTKKANPLGYQTLKHAHMSSAHRDTKYQIPPWRIFDTHPAQNWRIMWFELHWGTDYWCLSGLCKGALYLWCAASGEDRKPNRKHKLFKSLTC